jgi:hypothetical protein
MLCFASRNSEGESTIIREGKVKFTDEAKKTVITIIWQFASAGRYSVQTLYVIINDRGINQIYTP